LFIKHLIVSKDVCSGHTTYKKLLEKGSGATLSTLAIPDYTCVYDLHSNSCSHRRHGQDNTVLFCPYRRCEQPITKPLSAGTRFTEEIVHATHSFHQNKCIVVC